MSNNSLSAERTRWATIMSAPTAKGRSDLALELAKTSLSAPKALAVLDAAAGAGRFAHLAGAGAGLTEWANRATTEAQAHAAAARRMAPELFPKS